MTLLDGAEKGAGPRVQAVEAGGGGAAAVWSVTMNHGGVSRMGAVRKGRAVSPDARAWPAAELLGEP